jgi:hypothetical protein
MKHNILNALLGGKNGMKTYLFTWTLIINSRGKGGGSQYIGPDHMFHLNETARPNTKYPQPFRLYAMLEFINVLCVGTKIKGFDWTNRFCDQTIPLGCLSICSFNIYQQISNKMLLKIIEFWPKNLTKFAAMPDSCTNT